MSRSSPRTPPPSRSPASRSRVPLPILPRVPRVLTFSELENEDVDSTWVRRGHLTGGLAGMQATLVQQTEAERAHNAARSHRRAQQRQQAIAHVALFLLYLTYCVCVCHCSINALS
jgi:hypothetical protein